MLDRINQIREEAGRFKAATQIELEEFRLKYLSKKGQLNSLFEDFKNVTNEQKREIGQKLNELKNVLSETFERYKETLNDQQSTDSENDLTRPEIGRAHV